MTSCTRPSCSSTGFCFRTLDLKWPTSRVNSPAPVFGFGGNHLGYLAAWWSCSSFLILPWRKDHVCHWKDEMRWWDTHWCGFRRSEHRFYWRSHPSGSLKRPTSETRGLQLPHLPHMQKELGQLALPNLALCPVLLSRPVPSWITPDPLARSTRAANPDPSSWATFIQAPDGVEIIGPMIWSAWTSGALLQAGATLCSAIWKCGLHRVGEATRPECLDPGVRKEKSKSSASNPACTPPGREASAHPSSAGLAAGQRAS